MRKVRIEAVNVGNWYECCMLKTFDSQKDFVDPNSISLAQSKFEQSLKPLAIYCDDKLVGFAMYNTKKEELNAYWLYRLMIDSKYQKNGIGKEAMELIIKEMKQIEDCDRIALGYSLENSQAENFYKNIGFEHKGDIFGKEKAVVLEV